MNRKKREIIILDSAVRVFNRDGYARSSVSKIIDEARVARGTFYLYFKNKQDVLDAWIDRLAAEIGQALSEFNSSLFDTTLPKINHQELTQQLVQAITKNRPIFNIILRYHHELAPSSQSKVMLFFDQITKVLQHQIEMGIEQGVFRYCHSTTMAQCLLGSVKELIGQWLINDGFNKDASIETIRDLIGVGLMPVAKPPFTEEAKTPTRPSINDLH